MRQIHRVAVSSRASRMQTLDLLLTVETALEEPLRGYTNLLAFYLGRSASGRGLRTFADFCCLKSWTCSDYLYLRRRGGSV